MPEDIEWTAWRKCGPQHPGIDTPVTELARVGRQRRFYEVKDGKSRVGVSWQN